MSVWVPSVVGREQGQSSICWQPNEMYFSYRTISVVKDIHSEDRSPHPDTHTQRAESRFGFLVRMRQNPGVGFSYNFIHHDNRGSTSDCITMITRFQDARNPELHRRCVPHVDRGQILAAATSFVRQMHL